MTRRAPPTERDEARSRHPANGRWRPDLRRLADQVAGRLGDEGLEWPDVAAAALAARGVAGVDQRGFAAELGIPETTLIAAETGGLPVHDLPAALRSRLPIPPGRRSAAADAGLDHGALEAAVAEQPGEFRTSDVSDHEAVRAAHPLPPAGFVSAVGRWLAANRVRLRLERLPPDGGGLGARWRRAG